MSIDPRHPGKMLTPVRAIERIRKLLRFKGEFSIRGANVLGDIEDIVLRVRAPKPDHRSRNRKAKAKCACTQRHCCAFCWKREANTYPCGVSGCENPAGHSGPHGAFSPGVIRMTASELLGIADSR